MHLRAGQSGRGGKPLRWKKGFKFNIFFCCFWSFADLMRCHLELIRCLLQLCVVQGTPEDLRPPDQVVSILDFPINVTAASNTEFQLIFQLKRQPWSFCCQCSGNVFMFRVHLKSKLYNIWSHILLFDVSKGGTCVFTDSPGSYFIHISSSNSKACCANMAEWCSRAVSVCL